MSSGNACAHFGGLPSDLVHQLGYGAMVGGLVASLRRDGRNVWGPDDAMLQHGDVHPEMAFWMVFLNYNLIAAHHRTNVSFDTAQILYAICWSRRCANKITMTCRGGVEYKYTDLYFVKFFVYKHNMNLKDCCGNRKG